MGKYKDSEGVDVLQCDHCWKIEPEEKARETWISWDPGYPKFAARWFCSHKCEDNYYESQGAH